MGSDGNTGKIPVASPVHGSPTVNSVSSHTARGKPLPASGKTATSPEVAASAAVVKPAAGGVVVKPAVQNATYPQSLLDQLNKHLNDSGRPIQFRLDPASNGKMIQQINPATGAVIGEFSVAEFPALARSVGAAGALIDSLA